MTWAPAAQRLAAGRRDPPVLLSAVHQKVVEQF
jgi:hypothetical protein